MSKRPLSPDITSSAAGENRPVRVQKTSHEQQSFNYAGTTPTLPNATQDLAQMSYRISDIPLGWDDQRVIGLLSKECSLGYAAKCRLLLYLSVTGGSQVGILWLLGPRDYIDTFAPSSQDNPKRLIMSGDTLITIDRHFHGLTPLNAVSDKVVADVVAVTGLGGHAYGSWKHRESGKMWLQDFLPNDLKGRVRVMTYGYNTSLTTPSTRTTGMVDFVRDLIQKIKISRSSAENRTLVFVGHSLGCIIIAKALLLCKLQDQHHDIFKATRLVFFFGAPHKGLRTEELEEMVDDLQIPGSDRSLELLGQLREHSSYLQEHAELFVNIWKDHKIVSFYETSQTPVVRKNSTTGTWGRNGELVTMVQNVSSLLFTQNEERIPVPRNHSEIVKFLSPSDEVYRILVQYIEETLKNIGSNNMKIPTVQEESIPFMVPYPQNRRFVGQDESRSAINLALGPDGGHRRLAVWGLGGVGKTQTVLDYVYQFQKRIPVFWIHAATRVKFEQDYRKIAKLALLPGYDDNKVDIRPLVRDWLENASESGDWILVLDNADNIMDVFGKPDTDEEAEPSDGLANFIPYGSKGTVLVTTRDEVIASRLCDGQVLPKEAMSHDDSISLFKSLCPRITTTKSYVQPLDDLLEELSYLPLAIAQAASYLRENRLVTLPKYLDLFRNNKKERLRLLSKPFTDLRRNKNLDTVLATFTLSFKQVEEQSTLAGSLLRVMACINRQGMPIEMFHSIKGPDDKEMIEEALSRMISFSLLTLSHDSTVEMHAFIHLSAQNYLRERQILGEATRATTVLLAQILPEGKLYEHRSVWREYLPHASTFFNLLEDEKIHPDNDPLNITVGPKLDDFYSVYYRLGTYYLYAGEYSNAEILFSRTTKLYGKEDPRTLNSMMDLASTYRSQGRWKEAAELGIRAMELCINVLGNHHPTTLVSMVNLAATYWNQGQWKEAEKLEVQVMETRKSVLGEEHPNTLISMGNLASTYNSQGRWEQAEQLEIRVMETRKRVFGENHPDTLTSMENLAGTYKLQGRLHDAEGLVVKVMEGRKKALGKDHPGTLISMGSLAAIYGAQGRWKEAEELYARALDAFLRVLGKEHPQTLMSMSGLAMVYWNRGQFEKAEELEIRIMETRKRIYGEDHPDTLTSINNLATTYGSRGRWKDAEELYKQVMETRKRLLGEQHPSTLTSMVNLATTYGEQGRFSEEAEIEVQIIEARITLHGKTHPDTAISMANLGSTLTKMANLALKFSNEGRYSEAEKLQVEIIEARKKVFGRDHQDTLISMFDLASTYEKQGRFTEVEELDIKIIKTMKRVFGDEHPDTLSSIAKLALTYKKQGRYCEAEKLQVQVLETRKRVFGPDEEHPSILSIMGNLAETYWSQGRLKEAEELEVRIVDTRKRVFGETNPDTVTAMSNLAFTLASQKRLSDAVSLMERTVELSRQSPSLGESHPKTLSLTEHLGRWKNQVSTSS